MYSQFYGIVVHSLLFYFQGCHEGAWKSLLAKIVPRNRLGAGDRKLARVIGGGDDRPLIVNHGGRPVRAGGGGTPS